MTDFSEEWDAIGRSIADVIRRQVAATLASPPPAYRSSGEVPADVLRPDFTMPGEDGTGEDGADASASVHALHDLPKNVASADFNAARERADQDNAVAELAAARVKDAALLAGIVALERITDDYGDYLLPPARRALVNEVERLESMRDKKPKRMVPRNLPQGSPDVWRG